MLCRQTKKCYTAFFVGLFLFPSIRLRAQLRTLASQCGMKHLLAAYDEQMAEPIRDNRVLLLDMSPDTLPQLRIRASFLDPDNSCCYVYFPIK